MKKKNQSSSNRYLVIGLSVLCILLMGLSIVAQFSSAPFRQVADVTVIPMQKGINQIGAWLSELNANFKT